MPYPAPAEDTVMEPSERNLLKISIPLRGAALESGFAFESVWAEPLGNGRYMIWNVPVFAYNIEMRAIVKCEPDPNGGLPVVTSVVTQGDCLGVRVYFDADATDEQIQTVLDLLNSRNALSEKYRRELWAFGLRALEDYAWVGSALEPFVEAGILSFESNMQPEEPGYEPQS
jgi:hypothetical protein